MVHLHLYKMRDSKTMSYERHESKRWVNNQVTFICTAIFTYSCTESHAANIYYTQCWGKLLLKVMQYNIALFPKKVTIYAT